MTVSFWVVALLILSNKLSRWHSPNERTASQWKGSQVKVFDSTGSNQVYSSLLCGTHFWGPRFGFLLWSHLHLKVLISEKENDACAVINIRTWPDRKWSAGINTYIIYFHPVRACTPFCCYEYIRCCCCLLAIGCRLLVVGCRSWVVGCRWWVVGRGLFVVCWWCPLLPKPKALACCSTTGKTKKLWKAYGI